MPTLRGAKDTSVETPLLLVGGALLLVLALALMRYNELRDRRLARQRMHEPLHLDAAAPLGTLDQISRRKQDLHRFIGRLRTQLAAREEQLRVHDELEDIVTARVETTSRQDKEWRKIMKAGKKLHGRKWDAPNGDAPSLRELMELHKEELLAYKADMTERQHSARDKASSARSARIMQLPLHHVPIATTQSHVYGHDGNSSSAPIAKVGPPQWQSTRRVASTMVGGAPPTPRSTTHKSMSHDAGGGLDDIAVAIDDSRATPSRVVPLLDFSKLAAAPVVRNDDSDEHVVAPKSKSFELAFQRQARLAKTLKKKK